MLQTFSGIFFLPQNRNLVPRFRKEINIPSLFKRVASLFALMTHQTESRLQDGAMLEKKAHAV